MPHELKTLRRCEKIPVGARHGVPVLEFSRGYKSRNRAPSISSQLRGSRQFFQLVSAVEQNVTTLGNDSVLPGMSCLLKADG